MNHVYIDLVAIFSFCFDILIRTGISHFFHTVYFNFSQISFCQPDLAINHHAQNTLESFGQWADRRNKINQFDESPAYDFAVLLTKYDIMINFKYHYL